MKNEGTKGNEGHSTVGMWTRWVLFLTFQSLEVTLAEAPKDKLGAKIPCVV